ncbi:pheromone alpha factor receptor [Hypoxylon texense]
MARKPVSFDAIKTSLTSRISHILAVILVAAAFALLIVVDATAPVNHGLALFTARNDHISYNLGGYNEGRPVVHFGTFGYCTQVAVDFSSTYDSTADPTPDRCSPTSIGYDPLPVLSFVSPTLATSTSTSTDPRDQRLTSALILHPLATGFSFLTLISAILPPSRLAPPAVALLVGSLTTALLLLAALACDFVLCGRLERRLDDADTAAVGSYGTGLWAVVAAFACLVVATALLGARWWWVRRRSRVSAASRELEVEMELEHKQDEGKTDRSSGSAAAAAAPPYEMGGKTGLTELSQGMGADRHELSEQQGRVELAGEERHELDTPMYSEPKSRLEDGKK